MAGKSRRSARGRSGIATRIKRPYPRRRLVLDPLTELSDPKRTLELAWAAGFFCGEGSFVSGWSRTDELWRVMFSITQKSTKGRPEVLSRFQQAVGLGAVGGPYSRQTYRAVSGGASATLRLAALLWPWLSRVKRAQAIAAFRKRRELLGGKALDRFLAAHGVAGRPPAHLNTTVHQIAWAAGLFDGEGWTGYFTFKRKRGTSYKLGISVRQSDRDGIPEVLRRFRAVAGVGTIDGPYYAKGRMPSYMWREPNRARIQQVVKRLNPYLGPVKRAQARGAIALVVSTPRLSSAPPQRTHCHRGHRFPKNRRAFTSRGWRQLVGCKICIAMGKRNMSLTGRVRRATVRTQWASVAELRKPLAPLVRELRRMPSFPEMRACGLDAVARRVASFGGTARVAAHLGLVAPPRVGRRGQTPASGWRLAA